MAKQPINVANFDPNNVSFASPYDSEYGYRMTNLKYAREDSTNEQFVIKVIGKVKYVKDNGNKFSMLLNVQDPYVSEINTINEHLNDILFNKREIMFDGITLQRKTAIEKLATKKQFMAKNKKSLIMHNEEYPNEPYTLPLDFNSNNVNISLLKTVPEEFSNMCDPIPDELHESTNPVEQLRKGMVIVMTIDIKNIINLKNATWNFKATTNQIIGLGIDKNTSSNEEREEYALYGIGIEDVNTDNITFTDVATKGPNNGKYIQLKYNNKGFNLQLSNVDVTFNKNNYQGKDNYTIGIPFGENDVFADIDDVTKKHMFDNQKDIFGKKINDELDDFSDLYKPTLAYNEKYSQHTLWTSMWVGEGEDFQGVVFEANGDDTFEKMSNDDIMKKLFLTKGQVRANIQIYHKHVWLGNNYTSKWAVSKVQVFPSGSSEFDLGFSAVSRDEETTDEFGRDTSVSSDEQEAVDTTVIDSGDEATSDEED